MTEREPLSYCCKSPVKIAGGMPEDGDMGTRYYVCVKCQKACSLFGGDEGRAEREPEEKNVEEIADEIVESYWLLRHSRDAKRALSDALRSERDARKKAEAENESRSKLLGELHKYHPDVLVLQSKVEELSSLVIKLSEALKPFIATCEMGNHIDPDDAENAREVLKLIPPALKGKQ